MENSSLAAHPPLEASYTDTFHEHGFDVKNFQFTSGESLPSLRLHCRTLGSPTVDPSRRTTNAVLILHGTGGSSTQFIQDVFAGELFGPGQLLDASKYYIILRDGIGHGKSSKPSDGLRAQCPKYGYRDMLQTTDANDFLHQIRSSSDYDPAPLLDRITVPLVAVNSADDQINPPELGLLEAGIKKVARGRAVVLQISDETRGHGSHTIAKLWKHELQSLLSMSATTT